MKGFTIYMHAVRMVLGNLQQAIRIAALPMAIGIVAATLLTDVGSLATPANPEQMLQNMDEPGYITRQILFMLILIFLSLWVTVNWHRFVLLEEYPNSWIPDLKLANILAYFGKGFQMGLLAFACMIPVVFIVAALGGGIATILIFGAFLLLAVGMYRVISVLPAAAIGKPLTFRDAWESTKDANLDIVAILIISFVVQLLIQAVASIIGLAVPFLGVAVGLVASAVLALIGVSVLTTFYGHYIEGRDLE